MDAWRVVPIQAAIGYNTATKGEKESYGIYYTLLNIQSTPSTFAILVRQNSNLSGGRRQKTIVHSPSTVHDYPTILLKTWTITKNLRPPFPGPRPKEHGS